MKGKNLFHVVKLLFRLDGEIKTYRQAKELITTETTLQEMLKKLR